MNVRINWECGYSKRLRHYNAGGFVTYTSQRFKELPVWSDFPSCEDNLLGHSSQVSGLCGSESDLSDVMLYFIDF
tara:strand:+ start:452 stop:676 length:225 start_codon:yes stop_codon:yes gene_type:complete